MWFQKGMLVLTNRWLAWTNLFLGVLFGLPWVAPVLMRIGATGPARAVYFVYGFLCHQLADRSFFLFGPKVMYSYTELQTVTPDANTWVGLRAFIGTAELGYKVAWSDRMVSWYAGIWLGGLLFGLLRHRIKRPRWRTFGLMVAPIVVDGFTHMISDVAELGKGFRYTNAWLATLTGNRLPESFYVGNALGSFNSWMRLITGLSFGLAVVWLVFPLLESSFRDTRQILERQEQLLCVPPTQTPTHTA
jgi:uncharacterized membrane protein